MRIYDAVCDLIKAGTDALHAWAEAERAHSLEAQFDAMDWNEPATVTVYIEDDDE
jgi:hypothetical protein